MLLACKNLILSFHFPAGKRFEDSWNRGKYERYEKTCSLSRRILGIMNNNYQAIISFKLNFFSRFDQ
ncbi:MAG: hypothetical protein A2Y41_04795 [Spirochaetes bacterium GWB1_36_13]|nr:MAG: hypothetical protein A2Y41_04795 [Spirochaetes bacterium GWB1_36_13]